MVTETTELAVYDAVSATIAEYKEENANLVFDYEDKQGAKDAKSHIAKLRKAKTAIAAVHKEAKAEALAFGRRLDKKKNELTGEVDEMIAVHKDPLDAIEAEKTRIALEKAQALEAEKAAEEAKKREEIEAREAEIYLKEQEIREAEDKLRKEQEEINRKQREELIADEAAAQAKLQADREAKAKAQAKELAEKKRKEAEEAKEQKRINNIKHRQAIDAEILKSLSAQLLDHKMAFKVMSLLQENKIPNVTINY